MSARRPANPQVIKAPEMLEKISQIMSVKVETETMYVKFFSGCF